MVRNAKVLILSIGKIGQFLHIWLVSCLKNLWLGVCSSTVAKISLPVWSGACAIGKFKGLADFRQIFRGIHAAALPSS